MDHSFQDVWQCKPLSHLHSVREEIKYKIKLRPVQQPGLSMLSPGPVYLFLCQLFLLAPSFPTYFKSTSNSSITSIYFLNTLILLNRVSMLGSRGCKHSAEIRHLLAAAPGILTGYLPLFKLSKSGCFLNTIRTEVETSTKAAFWLKASNASVKGIPQKSPRSLKIPFHQVWGALWLTLWGTPVSILWRGCLPL